MPKSSFERMFTYAKADTSERLEDFMTEAFALAIKADPAPIVEVLKDHDLLASSQVGSVSAETQVGYIHEGRPRRIDLQLIVRYEDAPATEVWFENKAHAPESGDQLTAYRAIIDARAADGTERHLVVLAPDPISSAENHVYIPWRDVGRTALRHDKSVLWADFAEFLKEKRMTEETALPITPTEADSLDGAHRLFTKMLALMREVNARGRSSTPEWSAAHWTSDGRVKAALLRQFVRKGRYVLRAGKGYAAFVLWGAEPQPDGLRFIVMVQADPKRTGVRSELYRIAAEWLPEWVEPDRGEWRVLVQTAPATDFTSDADAIEWFLGRLDELKAAGVIDLIPTLRKGPVADDEDEADDASEGHEDEADA